MMWNDCPLCCKELFMTPCKNLWCKTQIAGIHHYGIDARNEQILYEFFHVEFNNDLYMITINADKFTISKSNKVLVSLNDFYSSFDKFNYKEKIKKIIMLS